MRPPTFQKGEINKIPYSRYAWDEKYIQKNTAHEGLYFKCYVWSKSVSRVLFVWSSI